MRKRVARLGGESKLVDAIRLAAATEQSVYAIAKKVSTYSSKVKDLAAKYGIDLPRQLGAHPQVQAPAPSTRRRQPGGRKLPTAQPRRGPIKSPAAAIPATWVCTVKPVVPNGGLTATKLARLLVAANDAGLTVQDVVAASEVFLDAVGWKQLWATAKAEAP